MKRTMILALLLSACLISGCGSSGAAPAAPAAPAETAAPENAGTVVRYTIPWDDPVDMELCFRDLELLYARFNGEDDLDPADGMVTLTSAEGNSAQIEIAWSYGDTHTVRVENGEVTAVAIQGEWEDGYTEDWESLGSTEGAVITGKGTWEDTYSKDGAQLSNHSVADYNRMDTGEHWVGDNTEYYDKDGAVIKNDSLEIQDDGTYYREVTCYDGETVTERQTERVDSFVPNHHPDEHWWYKEIRDEKLTPVPGVNMAGEDVVTGTVKECSLVLGVTEGDASPKEVIERDDAKFWDAEKLWYGGFTEYDYSYDAGSNTWTCFKRNFQLQEELDAYPVPRDCDTFEAAEEFTRDSLYNVYAEGINTGNGWNWDDSVGNKRISEKLLADRCLEAAMYRGVQLANSPGKAEEGLNYLSRVFDAGYPTAAFESAVIYFNTKDYETSSVWYEKALDAGYDLDVVNVGYLYENEAGAYELAAYWYEKAYDAGFSAGALDMGWLYANGLLEKDAGEKALEWFEKAYSLHDGTIADGYGAFAIGELYMKGALGEVDQDKAVEWYEKSIEVGCGMTAKVLGNMYLNGSLGDADVDKAMEYFDKALNAKEPDAEAGFYAGYYYAPFTPNSSNDIETALKWYLQGAERGETTCMHAVALCYKYSPDDGTGANAEKAEYWEQMYKDNK